MYANTSNISMEVESLIMRELGTYNNMYLRPITVEADQDHINTLNEVITTQYTPGTTTPVSPEAMMSMSSIIHPSALPTTQANIAEGWGTKRLSFILKVAVYANQGQLQQGNKQVYFIQGFTGWYDPTYTGKLDDEMPFFINNIVLANETMTVNGPVHSIISSSNVLFNPEYLSGAVTGDYHSARPEDVFSTMGTIEAMQGGEQITDQRTKLTSIPKIVNKKVHSPTVYLSEIINSWVMATEQTEFGNSVNDIYSAAKSHLYSGDFSRNPFIRAISNISGYDKQSVFTLNNLKEIDPNLPHKSKLVVNDQAATPVHTTGETEDWSIPKEEAQLATQIGNIMSAITMESMATNLTFFATNANANGDEVTIISANFMVNTQYTNQVNALVSRIKRDIVPSLSLAGNRLYSISVVTDALGESYVDISLNGQPNTRYCIPTFADSMISSLLVPSSSHLMAVADGMTTVLSEARTSLNNVESAVTPMPGSFFGSDGI